MSELLRNAYPNVHAKIGQLLSHVEPQIQKPYSTFIVEERWDTRLLPDGTTVKLDSTQINNDEIAFSVTRCFLAGNGLFESRTKYDLERGHYFSFEFLILNSDPLAPSKMPLQPDKFRSMGANDWLGVLKIVENHQALPIVDQS